MTITDKRPTRPAHLPPLKNYRQELAEALLAEQYFDQRRQIRRSTDVKVTR